MKRQDLPDKLPESPGVYMFLLDSEILYIGMSKNLKSRINSYFSKTLVLKTKKMVAESNSIKIKKTGSEFEALIVEAKLVRKYMPKYNSELKDDKSPLYIGITKEEFPRIITLRQSDLSVQNFSAIYGPFINSGSVKRLLRIIRKIIPYSQHKITDKPCIYSQMGLCDPCPSVISKMKGKKRNLSKSLYLKNISQIKRVLRGNISLLERILVKKIREFSKNAEYEKAQKIYNFYTSLLNLTDKSIYASPFLSDPNFSEDVRALELKELSKLLFPYFGSLKLKRIECFDVAHVSGAYPTASMVTFVDGEPEKSFYRHFKIEKEKGGKDTDSLKSAILRRRKHFDDWGKADLTIVDGGRGQVSAAIEILGESVPVIGIAKKRENIIIKHNNKFVSLEIGDSHSLRLIQRLRDESHRFARRYHHKLIKKALTV